jgi:hypothetical protein
VMSGTSAVLACSAGIAMITLAVTVNPTLRRFPTDQTPTSVSQPKGTDNG